MAFGLRGSGRAALCQGALFCNLFGRRFCVQNGHLDAAQTHKNTWFWDTLCAKGGAQKSSKVSLILPKATVFPSFFANSGGHLSGQNGPVDTLLDWLCCLGGVGGVFLLVFVQGFFTKVASWLRYLGGMACVFFHYYARILYKSRQAEHEQKGEVSFSYEDSLQKVARQGAVSWLAADWQAGR